MTPVSVTMAYVGKAWHKDNLLLIWYRKKEKKNEKIRVPQTSYHEAPRDPRRFELALRILRNDFNVKLTGRKRKRKVLQEHKSPHKSIHIVTSCNPSQSAYVIQLPSGHKSLLEINKIMKPGFV